MVLRGYFEPTPVGGLMALTVDRSRPNILKLHRHRIAAIPA